MLLVATCVLLEICVLAETIQPRSVNLALETDLIFRKENKAINLKFIDDVRHILKKIRNEIDYKPKSRRKTLNNNKEVNVQFKNNKKVNVQLNRNKEINVKLNNNEEVNVQFTDLVIKVVNVLKTYDDIDLEKVVDVIDKEIKQYHYKRSKFDEIFKNRNFRRYFANNLSSVKNLPATDVRKKLDAIAKVIEEAKFKSTYSDLIVFINSLYKKDDIKNLMPIIDNLSLYRNKYKRANMNLVKVLKDGIRTAIFDHYSKLSSDTRSNLKLKLESLGPDIDQANKQRSLSTVRYRPEQTKSLKNWLINKKTLEKPELTESADSDTDDYQNETSGATEEIAIDYETTGNKSFTSEDKKSSDTDSEMEAARETGLQEYKVRAARKKSTKIRHSQIIPEIDSKKSFNDEISSGEAELSKNSYFNNDKLNTPLYSVDSYNKQSQSSEHKVRSVKKQKRLLKKMSSFITLYPEIITSFKPKKNRYNMEHTTRKMKLTMQTLWQEVINLRHSKNKKKEKRKEIHDKMTNKLSESDSEPIISPKQYRSKPNDSKSNDRVQSSSENKIKKHTKTKTKTNVTKKYKEKKRYKIIGGIVTTTESLNTQIFDDLELKLVIKPLNKRYTTKKNKNKQYKNKTKVIKSSDDDTDETATEKDITDNSEEKRKFTMDNVKERSRVDKTQKRNLNSKESSVKAKSEKNKEMQRINRYHESREKTTSGYKISEASVIEWSHENENKTEESIEQTSYSTPKRSIMNINTKNSNYITKKSKKRDELRKVEIKSKAYKKQKIKLSNKKFKETHQSEEYIGNQSINGYQKSKEHVENTTYSYKNSEASLQEWSNENKRNKSSNNTSRSTLDFLTKTSKNEPNKSKNRDESRKVDERSEDDKTQERENSDKESELESEKDIEKQTIDENHKLRELDENTSDKYKSSEPSLQETSRESEDKTQETIKDTSKLENQQSTSRTSKYNTKHPEGSPTVNDTLRVDDIPSTVDDISSMVDDTISSVDDTSSMVNDTSSMVNNTTSSVDDNTIKLQTESVEMGIKNVTKRSKATISKNSDIERFEAKNFRKFFRKSKDEVTHTQKIKDVMKTSENILTTAIKTDPYRHLTQHYERLAFWKGTSKQSNTKLSSTIPTTTEEYTTKTTQNATTTLSIENNNQLTQTGNDIEESTTRTISDNITNSTAQQFDSTMDEINHDTATNTKFINRPHYRSNIASINENVTKSNNKTEPTKVEKKSYEDTTEAGKIKNLYNIQNAITAENETIVTQNDIKKKTTANANTIYKVDFNDNFVDNVLNELVMNNNFHRSNLSNLDVDNEITSNVNQQALNKDNKLQDLMRNTTVNRFSVNPIRNLNKNYAANLGQPNGEYYVQYDHKHNKDMDHIFGDDLKNIKPSRRNMEKISDNLDDFGLGPEFADMFSPRY